MTANAQESGKPSPAELFERFFGRSHFIPWSRVLLEEAKPQAGERVLDLACATGIVARDAADLGLPDGSFDLVLCQQGIQFFPDPLAALREAKRVLRDGGRLALTLRAHIDGDRLRFPTPNYIATATT